MLLRKIRPQFLNSIGLLIGQILCFVTSPINNALLDQIPNFVLMQPFSTDKAPAPVGLYPHARRAGNLLFLSGVGPRKAGSDEIPGLKTDKHGNFLEFDFGAQCRSVFDNVRIILEESGSSWDKLIDVTVFLVDMKRDFATYNRIYAEYFKDNQPCRTTVGITSLPTAIAIELKCIALVD